MIGQLRGHPVETGPDGTVILDVAGVGYEVTIPLGSLGRAQRDDAGALTLHDLERHSHEVSCCLGCVPS